MNILIVSAGVIASRIAAMLVKQGHAITIIDQSEAALDSISLRLDVKTVQGSGINPKVLAEADVEEADMVVAATKNDEMNVITCFIAKELGAKRTVARIQNPEYPGYFLAPSKSPTAPRRIVRPKKIGVDLLINPEAMAADHILSTLSSLFVTPVENLAGDLVQIGEFAVERNQITSIPIQHMDFSKPGMIAVIARSSGVFVPSEDDTLELSDHVYVVSAKGNMDNIGKMFSHPKRPARNVIIAGGGSIGFHIANGLEKMGSHVKIIEPNKDRCTEISRKLERTLVIQGEATSEDYLREEGVQSCDAFIAAVERDELNILISLLAKNLGTSRSLAIVNRQEYISLAETIGVDIVISPLLLANNAFIRFVREPKVRSVASLAGGIAEAIELTVESETPIIGQTLRKIGLPKNVVTGAIIRNGKVTIPNTDDTIHDGDRVILIGLQSDLPAAEKLFERK